MSGIKRGRLTRKPKKHRIWALYRGEELIADGNYAEITEVTGISYATLKFINSPYYENNRLTKVNRTDKVSSMAYRLVEIEEDEEIKVDGRKNKGTVYNFREGDKILATGTVRQIAIKMNMSIAGVNYYRSKRYFKSKCINDRELVEIE